MKLSGFAYKELQRHYYPETKGFFRGSRSPVPALSQMAIEFFSRLSLSYS